MYKPGYRDRMKDYDRMRQEQEKVSTLRDNVRSIKKTLKGKKRLFMTDGAVARSRSRSPVKESNPLSTSFHLIDASAYGYSNPLRYFFSMLISVKMKDYCFILVS